MTEHRWKPGQEVILNGRVVKIDRVTPSGRAVTEGRTFNPDGTERKDRTTWGTRAWLEPATPERLARIEKRAADAALCGQIWAAIDGWRLVDVADPQPVTDRRYYVTAVDGPRTAFLAGPYPTHAAALAQVDPVRRRTEDSYPFAVFWAFGTASLEGPPAKTWLGEFSG